MGTDDQIRRNDLAMLYELRLMISMSEKGAYTKEELLALLDQVAMEKKNPKQTATGKLPGRAVTLL